MHVGCTQWLPRNYTKMTPKLALTPLIHHKKNTCIKTFKKKISRQHVVTGQFWETHSIQIKNLNIEWKFNQESQLLKPYLKATNFKIFFAIIYIHTDSLNDYCLPWLSTFTFHSDWLTYTGKQWGWHKLHVNGLTYKQRKPSKNQREAIYVNLFYSFSCIKLTH